MASVRTNAGDNSNVNNKDFGKIAQSANLKAGGLAPGSKQNEIIAAEQKADRKTYPGPGKGSMVQGIKDIAGKGNSSKAIKELDAKRKSVGWGKSNYGTGSENRISKYSK